MSTILDRIKDIDQQNFIRFLESKGWKQSVSFEDKTYQYISPDEKYSALILGNKHYSDYNKVLTESLKSVSEYLSINLESLLANLLYPAYDVLKWRISNESTTRGTISLESFPQLLDSIKNTFSSALKDIENPALKHFKVNTKDATNLFKDLQVGQTEIGSYVINILSPLGYYQWDLFDSNYEEYPKSRKVIEHILSNINLVSRDINSGNKDNIEKALEQTDFSVNFLESILDIKKSVGDESFIELQTDWSVYLPPSQKTPTKVVLPEKNIMLLNNIIDQYTTQDEKISTESFVGKIAVIESNPIIDQREFVRIRMRTINQEGNAITLYSNLDYNAYFETISKAFSQGSNIILEGTYIEKGPRKKEIENASVRLLDI